ncbi:sigma-70 family RNA polymerase sigma factor [Modestobacter sp. KNN46-3]|uniref:sigma-70 family RNA polymerase sigma factor n=1 Tax=Modestobacter sp. KNN46-3 TaxID=2711218 RepID=UPI0013E08B12|nr:sigma-70 family RNA polymerase sigma factor [Modestobacter sp. KNN46-3]
MADQSEQAALEVAEATRVMGEHLQAAISVAEGLETPEQQAQALQALFEMVERLSYRQQVVRLRAAAFQRLLDKGLSYTEAAGIVGLTKGGFQSALTRASRQPRQS